jgi:hypothetical protein
MSFLSFDLLPELDPVAGTFVLPLWMAGVVAALFVTVLALALTRVGTRRTIAVLVRYAVLLIGGVMAFIFFDRSETRDRAAERRAIETRALELVTRAIVPGSALACLDDLGGDTVESACEKAVFASPEATAAALSYVAARLSLLADGTDHAKRDRAVERTIAPLRRAAEVDHLGLYAQVLSQRDHCTADACDAFALLGDTSQIVANLKGRTFDLYLDRYANNWSARNVAPVATAAPPPATTSPAAGAAPPTSMTNLNFPSAASIPAVSIMNVEPSAPPGASGTSAAASEPAANARRPSAPTRRSSASSPAAPVQLTPPAPTPAPPVQLTPPPPPAASNGGAPRTPVN